MTSVEMRQENVLPNTPGASEMVVKVGQSRSQAYDEQCGHPTDPVETNRRQRTAERAFRERFPWLGNPFAADRYGEEVSR